MPGDNVAVARFEQPDANNSTPNVNGMSVNRLGIFESSRQYGSTERIFLFTNRCGIYCPWDLVAHSNVRVQRAAIGILNGITIFHKQWQITTNFLP